MKNEINEMSLNKLDGCINTYSGIKFDIFHPQKEMINIFDIAKGLAYKAHFGGQTPFYFSIAQHSVLVHNFALEKYSIVNKDILLAALLHDASEAYIGDMVKPLKIHLSNFCKIEDRITKVIFDAFNINIELLKVIKPFDKEAQYLEYDVFYNKNKSIITESPEESYDNYLQTFLNYCDIM